MKIGGAVAVLGIGMVASQIGTPHLLATYECDTDGRKCVRYTQFGLPKAFHAAHGTGDGRRRSRQPHAPR